LKTANQLQKKLQGYWNMTDGTFYKIIVRPPKTFIMPSHSVLFEPNSYEPLE
jgi:hypothetical protein